MIARLSLTQVLRSFEQGLLSPALLLGVVAAIGAFAGLAAVWLHPGVPARTKLIRSMAVMASGLSIRRPWRRSSAEIVCRLFLTR